MEGNGVLQFDIDKRNRITAAFEIISHFFTSRKNEKYPTPRVIKLKVDSLSSRKFIQLLYDLQVQCQFRDNRIAIEDPKIQDSHLQQKLMTLDASTYLKLISDVLQNFSMRNFDKLVTSYKSSKVLQQLSKDYCKLSVENEHLKQKRLELELAVREKRNSEIVGNKMEIEFYKGKKFIDKFEGPKAGIPYSHIIKLVKCLNDLTTHFVAKKKDWDIEGVFKTLSAINDTFRNMVLYLDIAAHKKQIFLLRLAISHMITTTRFFLSHSRNLPLLTVTSAISDVNFKICILVNHVGLKLTDIDKELIRKYAGINTTEDYQSDSRTEINIDTDPSLHSKPSLNFSAIIDLGENEAKSVEQPIFKEKNSVPRINTSDSSKGIKKEERPINNASLTEIVHDNIPEVKYKHPVLPPPPELPATSQLPPLELPPTADPGDKIEGEEEYQKLNINTTENIRNAGKPSAQEVKHNEQIAPAIPTIPTITVHKTDDDIEGTSKKSNQTLEPSVLNQLKNASTLEQRIDQLHLQETPDLINDKTPISGPGQATPNSYDNTPTNSLNDTPQSMNSNTDDGNEAKKQKFKDKIKKFGSSPGLGLRIISDPKTKPSLAIDDKSIVEDIKQMTPRMGQQKGSQNKLNLKSDLSSRASLHPMLKKFVAYEDEFWKSSPMLPYADVNSDNRVSRVDFQSLNYLVILLEPMLEKYELAFRKLLDNMKNNRSTRGSIRRESNMITTLVSDILDKTMQVLNNEDNWDVLKQFSDLLETLDSINNGLVNFASLNLKGKIPVETDDAEYAAHSFKQRIGETFYKISSSLKDLVKGLKQWEDNKP
ncbi:hypothetical protein RNJ44_00257 [Nakaseomyces bracarensis]|uniref:Uncharacterized protein n=1 Tax=Nakaseomyces bracarensis TaxID=273131 RepID=A0ABR4NTF5_9SACH